MFWASDQLMGRFDVSVFWKILCFQTVKCLSQVLVVRNDLKMKSGKIASQCARKILKLLLILWCSIWLQFLISSGPVLPVSLHSAVNSCFFFFLVKQMTKYSFMILQMLPLACMRNWCKGIIVLIMSLLLVQRDPQLCSLLYCICTKFSSFRLSAWSTMHPFLHL